MKIFWAWQSDLDDRVQRHFIKAALDAAIEQLKTPKDIEEPSEEARRRELEIDHDTKGLTGSPDVAVEILNKITNAAVFVGDVTPVGETAKNNKGEFKKLMNPNVAIELGYAMGKHSSAQVLTVLNLAYGTQKELPFDISHKRWPITYTLVSGATKIELQAELPKLTASFVTALAPFLERAAPQASAAPFPAKAPGINDAFYFADKEVLFRTPNPEADFTMPFRKVFYVRIHPVQPIVGHLDLTLLKNNVGRFGQFGLGSGSYAIQNKYGVIVGSPAGNTTNLDAVLQYFRTGEIWGINADIIRQGERGSEQWVVTLSLENTLIASLQSALRFHREVTKIPPPFYVEVGIVGVAGKKIVHNGYPVSNASPVLASDEVKHNGVLHKDGDQAVMAFLLNFFEKLNMDSGVARPKGLYGRG